MEVVVSRLSQMSDRIPLLISERLVDVHENYIGKAIEARGQFRSYNRHEEKHNRLVLSVFSRELKFVEEEDETVPVNQIFLAFLCTGDMFALNLIRMFEKNGKRAGQDYGIMGYDNIDFLEYVTPRLTTIDNHVEKVAEEAFNLLLQLMENKNVAETERILETVTVQGETI